MTPRPTLGQILRPFLASPAAAGRRLSPHQWKTLRALALCRTSALGGQAYFCPHCRREHVVAHSCRNRHCPPCQGAAAVDWTAVYPAERRTTSQPKPRLLAAACGIHCFKFKLEPDLPCAPQL